MTFEQLANLADIVGSIVIVLTMVFLVLQVRRNTQSLRSVATHSAHQQCSSLYDEFSDPSFTDLYLRATRDPTMLSAEDTMRLNAYWMRGDFNAQNWFFQTKEGAMPRELLDSYSKLIEAVTQTRMWKQYWEQRRFVFAPEYVAFIEGIRSRAGTRPYRPLGVSPDHNIEDKKARTAGGDAQQPVAADGEA